MSSMSEIWTSTLALVEQTEPRPGLHPIPGARPVTLEALALPPIMYYIALLFLPPAPPQAVDSITVKLLRNALALSAGVLFYRLPLAYYIPQSIGLNYQLSLVGLYGGCRVLDAFFISPLFFDHIPRRVRYEHRPRINPPSSTGMAGKPTTESANTTKRRMGYADNPASTTYWERRPSLPLDSYIPATATNAAGVAMESLSRTLSGPTKQAVHQVAIPEDGWPHSFLDRASWALELEMSMRGTGFTWTTADVRHTRKTWLPTVNNRLYSIVFHVAPVMLTCLLIIRTTHDNYLAPGGDPGLSDPSRFDTRLSLPAQLLLTGALGAFLMIAFSFAHSMFAMICAPLAPSPFAFFPPLYTTPIWEITSVRGFWSYGWHRLFARLFLVYGCWPGEWLERRLLGKGPNEPADLGKVIGGFLSSALVHSFSVRSVLGGDWVRARVSFCSYTSLLHWRHANARSLLRQGEGIFFTLNGLAVVLEEIFRNAVVARRKKAGTPLYQWYDGWIGRIWWISVLLFSGRNFARGWVNAGLVREMAGR